MSRRPGSLWRRTVIVVAILAAVGVGVAIGVVVEHSGSSATVTSRSATGPGSQATSASSRPAATSSIASPAGTVVTAASAAALRVLSRVLPHPVYWAGPRAGAVYEFTQTPDGKIYVRYLTRGAPVGSPRPDFLTIGSYPVSDPVARLRRAAHGSGGVALMLGGHAVGYYNRSRPSSVYLGYPGSGEEIEVYDPSPSVALGLVVSGRVKPIS